MHFITPLKHLLSTSALLFAAVLAVAASPASARAAADLTISGYLEAGDTVAEPGERVTVEYTARNIGDQDVEDPQVGFYFSKDAFFTTDDTFLEAETLGDLDAGETDDESEQFALPEKIADGEYYVLMVIDDLNRVAENDESNNVAAAAITIGDGPPGSMPDLYLDSSRITYYLTDGGKTIIVDYWVENLGDAPVDSALLNIYLSTDATLSDDDTYLRWDDADSILPGQSVYEDAIIDLPSGLAAGGYYILIQADPENNYEESNESNNVGAVGFHSDGTGGKVTVDLVMERAVVPRDQRTRQAGDTMRVDYQVTNLGPDNATNFEIAPSIVPKSNRRGGYAWPTILVDGLAAGEVLNASVTLEIPSGLTPDRYILFMEADASEQFAEPNESNNVARQRIRIE